MKESTSNTTLLKWLLSIKLDLKNCEAPRAYTRISQTIYHLKAGKLDPLV